MGSWGRESEPLLPTGDQGGLPAGGGISVGFEDKDT